MNIPKPTKFRRDDLLAAVELYEKALQASWPEGAMGDAFDYWNSARITIASARHPQRRMEGIPVSNKANEAQKRKLEVRIKWNGKANVCVHCGRVPETFYIVTGHDHTDDYFYWCPCRETSETIESLRHQLAEKDAEHGRELRRIGKQTEAVVRALQSEIAASQLREQRLRQKLENYKILCQDEDHYSHYLDALDALALPADTSALEALIARAGEVMRERCIEVIDCDAIRALSGVTLEDLK